MGLFSGLLAIALLASPIAAKLNPHDILLLGEGNPVCGSEGPEFTCLGTDVYEDILFIIDGSGSVEDTDFVLEKQFVKDLAPSMYLSQGENGNRAGVILFSTEASLVVPLTGSESQFSTDTLDIVRPVGTKTYITKALFLAEDTFQQLIADDPARAGSRKRIFVLTDGTPTGEGGSTEEGPVNTARLETISKSKALQDLGYLVTTIGIGIGADLGTLEAMASTALIADQPEVLFYEAASFADLQYIIENFQFAERQTCREEPKKPYFCDDTPNDGQQAFVCSSGSHVSFTVSVAEPNVDDTVDVIFPESNIDTYDISDPIQIQSGTSSQVRRVFSFNARPDLSGNRVCFQGVTTNEVVPAIPTGEEYIQIPDWESGPEFLVTEQRCVHLTLRYPPRFITDSVPQLNAKICEESSFDINADDLNSEENVSIFALEDPGLPNGAQVSQNKCPTPSVRVNSEGQVVPVPCNPVSRRFSWTPVKVQAGKTYSVCFLARDDSSFCQDGGYYSPESLCVDIAVLSPKPEWTHPPTPDHLQHMTAHVGCETVFQVQARDTNYCVKIGVDDSGPMPEFALPLVCYPGYSSDSEVSGVDLTRSICTTDLNMNCNFRWTPRRKQEGHTYHVCFNAADNICDLLEGPLHDGNLQHSLPDLAHATAVAGTPNVPLCFDLEVARCKYCVHEKDTLHYLNKYYHLDTNWLRLWNSNGNDDMDEMTQTMDNPDLLLPNGRVIHVGPVYTVQVGDTLQLLAARFHTTLKKILSVNPDVVEQIEAKQPLKPGQDLCVMPCTDDVHWSDRTYKYMY